MFSQPMHRTGSRATQGAEGLGFDQVQFFEHVVGANPATYPDIGGNTSKTPFHEPFVVMGYVAAVTQRAELVAGSLVLPQRQAVLVAKQAAEVDVLSGGRLRLVKKSPSPSPASSTPPPPARMVRGA